MSIFLNFDIFIGMNTYHSALLFMNLTLVVLLFLKIQKKYSFPNHTIEIYKYTFIHILINK